MRRALRECSRIDVVVAVAVISLLGTILLPTVAAGKAATRRTTCLANIRGLNAALQQYVTHWSAGLPFGAQEPSIQRNFWTAPLSQISKNAEKQRQCPEASMENPKIFTTGTAHLPWNQPDLSRGQAQTGAYTINGWTYEAHLAPSIYLGEEASWLESENRQSEVRPLPTVVDAESFYHLHGTPNTAQIPTFADAIWPETFPATSDPIPTDRQNGDGPTVRYHLGQMAISRHGNRVNVAFFGGDAEAVAVEHLGGVNWQAHWSEPAAGGSVSHMPNLTMRHAPGKAGITAVRLKHGTAGEEPS